MFNVIVGMLTALILSRVGVTTDGVWIGEYIYHLQVVTTNKYNTVAISTLQFTRAHNSLVFQSVTRRFLVTAPTMAIPLPPGSSPLFTDSRTELT
jgi:hypothetical protein